MVHLSGDIYLQSPDYLTLRTRATLENHVTDNDLPLFENDTHGQPSDRVFVISSNYTLAPLFSRGCLLPPILEKKRNLNILTRSQRNYLWQPSKFQPQYVGK